MIIQKMLTPLTVNNQSCRPTRTMAPTSITIHNTGNPSANALQHANAQSRGQLASMQMAVHYYVDDTNTIFQCLENNQQGWHAGDGTLATGGNYTSIAIEICQQKGINQVLAFKNAAWLAAQLLVQYGWGTTAIKQHHDWKSAKYPTGKDCPCLLRHATNGINWQGFLTMVETAISEGTAPQPTPPILSYPCAGIVTTNDKSLNLRAAPNTSATILTSMEKGAKLTVLASAQNGWSQVAYDGRTGYASAQYITLNPVPEQPATLAWYRVQVGAYTKKSNADAMSTTLNLAGYDTFVAFANGYHKVQTGAFTNKANAERLAEELKQKGFDVMIVAPSA